MSSAIRSRSSGVKSGDWIPTVKTRIFCASSCVSAESRLVDAADVVAVGKQHDPGRAERGAAHLGDGRRERVVDVRALGELRRLGKDGRDPGALGGERERHRRLRVEEDDGQRLTGVACREGARGSHGLVDRALHAVRRVDQQDGADPLRGGRREHG